MGTSERFEKRHEVLPVSFCFLWLFTVLLISPEAHAQSARVVPENTAQVNFPLRLWSHKLFQVL